MKIEASFLIFGVVIFCVGFFLGGGNLCGDSTSRTIIHQAPSSPSSSSSPSCPPSIRIPVPVAVTPGNPVSVDRGPEIPESQLKNDQPFVNDLPHEFLTKVVNPAAGNSILRGGTPKCVPGLSYSEKNPDSIVYDSPANCRNYREVSSQTMLDIGNHFGDDKVTYHHYEHGYDVYFGWPCIRKQSSKIKMMEIGLGCVSGGFALGPRSVKLWGQLLPNAQYTAVEYETECAHEWDTNETKRKLGPTSYYKIYQGDQSDFNRWKVILKQEAENMKRQGFGDGEPPMYDMIIDDAGHTMLQQVNSFLALWPYIKPGGIYIIEDIQTNWRGEHEHWGGTQRIYGTSHLRHSKNLVKHLLDRVHAYLGKDPNNKDPNQPIQFHIDEGRWSGILRVDCTHYTCVIAKRFAEP